MSAAGASGGYYETLGVAETATSEEIKRAYYRLVRRHRPTEQPDLFQRYCDAHRVLGDTRRRGAYDQSRRAGRRVQTLLDQAAGAIDRDASKAISLLKSAIALAPDLPRPRMLLAQAMLQISDLEAAEKQFRWLIADDPRSEGLRIRYARCLLQQGRFDDADAQIGEALRLTPIHYDALVARAKIQEASGHPEQAIATLEQAIAIDGREDIADLDALTALLVLLGRDSRRRPEEVEAARGRVLAVLVAADSESRGIGVLQLCRRARELYHTGDEAIATAVAELAEAAVSGERDESADAGVDETVKAEARSMAKFTLLTRQVRNLVADPHVDGALCDCLRVKYLDNSPADTRAALLDDLLVRIQDEVIEDPKRLATALEYLRREYPDLAADQEPLLNEIGAQVERRLRILGPEGKYDRALPDSTAMPGSETPAAGPAPRKGLLAWLRK